MPHQTCESYDRVTALVSSRLEKPSGKPICLAADSADEALAFLAQLFSEASEKLSALRDRVIVFDKPGVLPRLAAGSQDFIAVALTREVERELALCRTSLHSIAVYPRGISVIEPDVILEQVTYDTFSAALGLMGKGPDEITRLAEASGRSLTVLRRQLSQVRAVQTPEWASDKRVAGTLVPFMFVGAWDSRNGTDTSGLELLGGNHTSEQMEKECQSLSELNDAPLWSIGSHRGVTSKIDLLFAVAGAVTFDDLERFFQLARMVLGEDDPALDLEEDKRWAAAIYGKARDFSAVFRQGISQTLVLMSVHGTQLFNARLGIDPGAEARRIVRDLLPSPLTLRNLEANDRDLPMYAEAAPDELLAVIERDLRAEIPVTFGLLRPVDSSAMGSPSRTGLLWALEGLCWDPDTLPRAALVLARLAQIEINDNWLNKPVNSLKAVFCVCMPQTAADHATRLSLIKTIAIRYADVAWKICISQFGYASQSGHYSYRPRWRSTAYGFGHSLASREAIELFAREMVEMTLTWKDHSFIMLCDLLERIQGMSEADQARVWRLIEDWAILRASDAEKAAMREKVRVTFLSRRAAMRAKKNQTAINLSSPGKAIMKALEPEDLLNRNAWLFRSAWIEESAEEIERCEHVAHDERERRINRLRIEALSEIHTQRGPSGIIELSERSDAAWVVGALAVSVMQAEHDLFELLRLALVPVIAGEEASQRRLLIAGALGALSDLQSRERVMRALSADLTKKEQTRLLILAPFDRSTWNLVAAFGSEIQADYWTEVMPQSWGRGVGNDIEIIERLLKAGRPRAAFFSAQYGIENIDAKVIFRLMSAIALGGNEPPDRFGLDQYYVEEAFKQINKGTTLSIEQKARLEFDFIKVLARPWDRRGGYGIPNLERYVERHPELFVQSIAWAYRRSDNAADPPGYDVPLDRAQVLAERGVQLLEAIERIPGHNSLDELEAGRLSIWVTTVRRSCVELGRADIADICIGKVLSCAPVGGDGLWPAESVRDVMEETQSEKLIEGAVVGVFNSRGAHWRRSGGDQERGLAGKYRAWGNALRTSHPFVASKLLLGIATMFDQHASREDTDARIMRRVR